MRTLQLSVLLPADGLQATVQGQRVQAEVHRGHGISLSCGDQYGSLRRQHWPQITVRVHERRELQGKRVWEVFKRLPSNLQPSTYQYMHVMDLLEEKPTKKDSRDKSMEFT